MWSFDMRYGLHENSTVHWGDVCNRLFSVGKDVFYTDWMASFSAPFEGNTTKRCKEIFALFLTPTYFRTKNIMADKLTRDARSSLSTVYYVRSLTPAWASDRFYITTLLPEKVL